MTPEGYFFGQFSVFFLPIVPAVDGGISSSLKYSIDIWTRLFEFEDVGKYWWPCLVARCS